MKTKKNKVFAVIMDDLTPLFTLLQKKYQIYAKTKSDKDNCLFTEVHTLQQIDLNHGYTTMSPKSFFLPQSEVLIDFNTPKNEARQPDKTNKPAVLFGIRPCDVLAIEHFDRVFLENDPPDPYYSARRKTIFIVSMACSDPLTTCFCTSVGCDPAYEGIADIIIFPLDKGYLAKALSDDGKMLINDLDHDAKPAGNHDFEEKDQNMVKAREKISAHLDLEKFRKKISSFHAPFWDKLHQKCLGCGVCTYLCPTCHCFDMTDELIKSSGRRVRTWDSCMFPLFTLHASGHNPRPSSKERMRQRIMHKFNYTVEYYGVMFCVGCGRCVSYCPVNIDIRKIIKDIGEEK